MYDFLLHGLLLLISAINVTYLAVEVESEHSLVFIHVFPHMPLRSRIYKMLLLLIGMSVQIGDLSFLCHTKLLKVSGDFFLVLIEVPN